MAKKINKLYIGLALVALVILGYLVYTNKSTLSGGRLSATMSLGSAEDDSRQVRVTYGATNTVLNYVQTLGITISVSNTGGTDLSNVRVTAANPAILDTKCNGTISTLAAGTGTGTISCSLTSAELTALVGAAQQWTVTLTARDNYRGADLTPVTTTPLSVTIAGDPAGTYTVGMGIAKTG